MFLRDGAPDDGSAPLAKSPRKQRSREREREVAEAAALPPGFRHEMLSLTLAQQFLTDEISAEDCMLFLHLIAIHGHARPFAPVCKDTAPSLMNATFAGRALSLSSEQRAILTPPHRLDSGVTDRFWILCRRYGWWGLSYREAILRLADWYVSTHPKTSQS